MVDQILTVIFTNGYVKKFKRSNWADLIDLREKYDSRKDVKETQMEYDI